MAYSTTLKRMALDVLVVGSGGREHALAWKLAQSPRIGKLYIAPGNGGTAAIAQHVAIDAMDIPKLAQFAHDNAVGLTVVSADDPLAAGIVDYFTERGLRIWGPTKAAAQLEWSKAYAKQFMQEAGIPTARYQVCRSADDARSYVRTHSYPLVVKASGLALGKGVYICASVEEADKAIDEIMVQRVHMAAGTEVVIEEFLQGREISIHAMSNGLDHILFPSSQDNKRALDGDQGGQTGGMGVVAPVPAVSEELMTKIDIEIVGRTFEYLKKLGIAYVGILYPGIMVTPQGPKVLEFNARFGDPETQTYMRLLETDLLDLIEASTDGDIGALRHRVGWSHQYAVNIVLASGGYPDSYQKGFPITGIKQAEQVESVVVFHAGTKLNEAGDLVTNGGRVLGISALGMNLQQALDRAYQAAELIHFEGKQYRKDIGAKAV